MNKNVKIIFIAILIVLLTFVGCDNKIYHWEFAQDYNNVKEIQIIEAKMNMSMLLLKI